MNNAEIFRGFKREFFRALSDRPLNLLNAEERALYVDLHEPGHSPIDRLFDGIDLAGTESVQLVTGFRGTGKTTGFSELERRLWEAGFWVIRIDLDGYVGHYSPINIRDFLLISAGAVGDKLADERLLGEKHASKLNFWERIKKIIPKIDDVELTLGAGQLKMSLTADRGFRARVRDSLRERLGELTEHVRGYYAEIQEALKVKNNGQDVRLVVIYDSLEHIRGMDAESGKSIRQSLRDLFLDDAARIRLPGIHQIISVPAFMAMEASNLDAEYLNGVHPWPAYKVCTRDGEMTPVVARMKALIEKRGDWKKILPDEEALHEIILASGGYLRDLFRMLLEALRYADGGKPAADVAKRVKLIAQRSKLPLYREEVEVLRRIVEGKRHGRRLEDIAVSEQEYVLRFLDAGLILCYLNDDFWYDIHPLLRDIVCP